MSIRMGGKWAGTPRPADGSVGAVRPGQAPPGPATRWRLTSAALRAPCSQLVAVPPCPRPWPRLLSWPFQTPELSGDPPPYIPALGARGTLARAPPEPLVLLESGTSRGQGMRPRRRSAASGPSSCPHPKANTSGFVNEQCLSLPKTRVPLTKCVPTPPPHQHGHLE